MQTEYEEKRLENIKRNQEILKELGLLNHQEPVPSKPKKRVEKPIARKETRDLEKRRSLRINGTSLSQNLLSNYINENAENVVERALRSSKRRKMVVNHQSVPIQPDTTRSMNADTFYFLENLAFPIDTFGKAAVVELAGSGTLYKFNKYSGVTEWNNSLFLWVNLFDEKNEFINSFLHGGKNIQWFGGSKMHKDSPVIQRLCDNYHEKRNDSILLFARLPSKPYFCLGRCKAKTLHLKKSPICIVWELLDYKLFCKKSLFQELISNEYSIA